MPSPTTAIRTSDAASALLMCQPPQCPTSFEVSYPFGTRDEIYRKESVASEEKTIKPKHGFVIPAESSPMCANSAVVSSRVTTMLDVNTPTPSTIPSSMEMEIELPVPVLPTLQRRPRSGSEGLDYLAFLAEQERQNLDFSTATERRPQQQQITSNDQLQETTYSVVTPPTTIVNHPHTSSSSSSSSNSDTDDSEAMPPPQPRRPRSISNPDYMMSSSAGTGAQHLPVINHSLLLGITTVKQKQQHFVLPPHLLLKELANARNAVVRKAAADISKTPYRYNRYDGSTTIGSSSFRGSPTIPEHAVYLQSNNNDRCDYYNHNATGKEIEDEEQYDEGEGRPESGDEYDDDDDDGHDEIEITDSPDDQDTVDGDGSHIEIPMDASISSIELLRRARSRLLEDLLSETNILSGSNDKSITILPHTLSKYKMVYNQNGRVGIYTPQERAAIIARYLSKRAHRNWNKKIRYNCRKSLADRRLRVKGRFVKRCAMKDDPQQNNSAETTNVLTHSSSARNNDHMPDVNDPEAGFCPTVEQPYRRLRRHTVT